MYGQGTSLLTLFSSPRSEDTAACCEPRVRHDHYAQPPPLWTVLCILFARPPHAARTVFVAAHRWIFSHHPRGAPACAWTAALLNALGERLRGGPAIGVAASFARESPELEVLLAYDYPGSRCGRRGAAVLQSATCSFAAGVLLPVTLALPPSTPHVCFVRRDLPSLRNGCLLAALLSAELLLAILLTLRTSCNATWKAAHQL